MRDGDLCAPRESPAGTSFQLMKARNTKSPAGSPLGDAVSMSGISPSHLVTADTISAADGSQVN